MSNAQLERYGRWTIWFLLLSVAVEGVFGHYFDPLHYKVMAIIGPEYADHDVLMDQTLPNNSWVHRFLGLALLVLGALQFNADLRRRKPQLHRWMGRAYLLLAMITMVSGIVFALITPFAGGPEQLFVFLVSLSLLFMLSRAWILVRQRDFVRHREWMIRGYALFLFIVVQRLLTLPLIPLGWPEHDRFLVTAFLAVIIVMVAAETWINLSRRPSPQPSGVIP